MYVVNPRDGELNDTYTAGYVGIKKVHNKKPEGKFHVEFLRDMIDMAEEKGMDEVYMYTSNGDETNTGAGLIALMEDPDDEKAVMCAGRFEE